MSVSVGGPAASSAASLPSVSRAQQRWQLRPAPQHHWGYTLHTCSLPLLNTLTLYHHIIKIWLSYSSSKISGKMPYSLPYILLIAFNTTAIDIKSLMLVCVSGMPTTIFAEISY